MHRKLHMSPIHGSKCLLRLLVPILFFVVAVPVSYAISGNTDAKRVHALASGPIGRGPAYSKILVEIDVPDYAKLLEASRAYKVRIPGRANPQRAFRADAALADRIREIADRVLATLPKDSYRIHHRYSTLPVLSLDVSGQALSLLQQARNVVRIEEDRLIPLTGVEKPEKRPLPDRYDDFAGAEPALTDTVDLIGARQAWEQGYTGAGWYVAVLDTGIRNTHEMFQGKNIVEACFSNNGDCPGGLTEAFGPGSARHYENYFQGYDHGTHVAGIAAGDNGQGLSGVAKGSGLIAIQVFSRFYTCGDGTSPCVMSWTSDQIKALEYVYELRNTYAVASVNMSLGGGTYPESGDCDAINFLEKTAIDNLRDVGIVTTIAAGNDGYCHNIASPACISSAVAVGASTKDDVEAYFSNWEANLLDLFAPGVSILSSTGDSDTSYASWNGTSMAAPHVAGAFAILRQKYTENSVTELIGFLTSTGHPIVTRCPDQNESKPRIQVDSALRAGVPIHRDAGWLPSVLSILLDE